MRTVGLVARLVELTRHAGSDVVLDVPGHAGPVKVPAHRVGCLSDSEMTGCNHVMLLSNQRELPVLWCGYCGNADPGEVISRLLEQQNAVRSKNESIEFRSRSVICEGLQDLSEVRVACVPVANCCQKIRRRRYHSRDIAGGKGSTRHWVHVEMFLLSRGQVGCLATPDIAVVKGSSTNSVLLLLKTGL
jgi:hypothetical protein